jgi:hypothetical protein
LAGVDVTGGFDDLLPHALAAALAFFVILLEISLEDAICQPMLLRL